MNEPLEIHLRTTVQAAIRPWYATLEEVRGPARSDRIRRARNAAIRALADLKGPNSEPLLNPEEIAAWIGRDRTTVLYHLGKTKPPKRRQKPVATRHPRR